MSKNNSSRGAAGAAKLAGKVVVKQPTAGKSAPGGFLPGVKKPAKPTFRKSFSELFGHFFGVAISGAVIATLLAVLSYAFGSDGLNATAHDLWVHSWAIHPFFYCGVACVVCGAICAQGQHLSQLILDRFFTKPLLSAMAHLLSFSAGTVLPLATVSHQNWATKTCQSYAGLTLLFLALVMFALMAVGGLLIVTKRADAFKAARDARKAPSLAGSSPLEPEEANWWQLLIFLALFLFFFGVSIYAARLKDDTEAVVSKILGRSEVAGCLLMKTR